MQSLISQANIQWLKFATVDTAVHSESADHATHAVSADSSTRASSADAVAWSGVTDKPSSFAPSTHSHPVSALSGVLPVSSGGTGRTDGRAVALTSSRSISLSGDVTGSGSFDGSSNVNIAATLKVGGGTTSSHSGMIMYAMAGYPASPVIVTP